MQELTQQRKKRAAPIILQPTLSKLAEQTAGPRAGLRAPVVDFFALPEKEYEERSDPDSRQLKLFKLVAKAPRRSTAHAFPVKGAGGAARASCGRVKKSIPASAKSWRSRRKTRRREVK